MVAAYASIRADNERRYGTDIGRIGPMLLADRYADRTHFIFELLQNAEDALARRSGWKGKRSVSFELSKAALRVSHFGTPFTEADVRGICGIGESTKDLTSIGRFGIGFKSVYAFTDCPEVHSGQEHFAIDSFVWPRAVPPIGSALGETTFILPLRKDDASAFEDISGGLSRLGPRTLLFLREIEDIAWSVENGVSGLFLRSKPEPCGKNSRKVTVMGQERGTEDVIEETWLIFSREVPTPDGKKAGRIEAAWQLAGSEDSFQLINPINDSRLVAFFPTIVPTGLGFLLQGPYRTTPSRDNVPAEDPWNKSLVDGSATLVVEALHGLRNMGLLDTEALRSLPLDRTKFGANSMFAPLFDVVKEALTSQTMLPRFGGGHVTAATSRLARTQDLRELFSASQLASLFHATGEVAWLSEDITSDRTPELRRYLMLELDVAEITPEAVLPILTKPFLEAQTDAWVVRLYEFLNSQTALLRQNRLGDISLIRLEDGHHVTPRIDGQLQAFLPGSVATDFPTVRRAVCSTDGTKALLAALGLTEPDPVDDLIRNVLPRYRQVGSTISLADYTADMKRMLNAFRTDSKSRRDSLVLALRDCPFVAAIDAGSGGHCFAEPTRLYIATERLSTLFEGVPGVLLVDNTYDCLRGEDVRELLEACGATRYLQPIPFETDFSREDLLEMRRKAGCEDCTWNESIDDYILRGLDALLKTLPTLSTDSAKEKAAFLWEALCDVQDRRGTSGFLGTYIWKYLHLRMWNFDAAFVRLLNATAWVPDRDGKLQTPGIVLFKETGWKENPFLLSKMHFKPPAIEALAREAGIEPGVLDLLKKLGVTSEQELKARLGIEDELPHAAGETRPADLTPDEALERLLGDTPEQTPPVAETPNVMIPGSTVGRGHGAGVGSGTGTSGYGSSGGTAAAGGPSSGQGRTPGSSGGRRFVSYVGMHPNNEEPDPDGLEHDQRVALEEKAIAFVLRKEPRLERTPTNNPGFDLTERGPNGQLGRWVEVKAMTGDLTGRPVGLSRTQFDRAREHHDAYWLYVVENASDPTKARIVRIQDPAGKAQTFTFDHGWLSVAEIENRAEPSPQDKTERE